MHCSQHQLERVLRSHFSFYAAYFPTVFEYFSLFSVHDELCRGFRGPGEVHAPNVFSFLKMTVQLSFLKAQPLANHSFQQILECREIPETMKARPYQNFFDNPWWGLAGERKAMATPRKTANAADRPFPLLFSIQKSSLLPEVKYAKLQSYFVATTVFQRPEILAPSKTFTSSQPPTHIIYLLHIPTADAIMKLFFNN